MRIAALFNDVWLDEAWTIEMLTRLDAPIQHLTVYQHPTNHFLNTVVLGFFRPLLPDYVYRLPAAIAGIVSLIIFGLVAERQCRRFAAGPCILYVVSLVCIVLGTEARGYGFVLLCGLGALLSLDALLEREDWRFIGAYWVCAALGFLAHPSFIVFFSSLVAWSILADLTGRISRWVEILLKYHLVPLGFALLVHLRFYRFIPPELALEGDSLLRTAVAAASISVGGPDDGSLFDGAISLARILAAAVACAGVSEIAFLAASGSRYVMLYFLGIVVMPVVWSFTPFFPAPGLEYFLMPTVLGYLLLGSFLSRIASYGLVGRTVAALLLSLVCLGNISRYQEFLEFGRGRMRRAFEYLVANSRGPEVSIAGSEDQGNEILVSYYRSRIDSPKPIIYRGASESARNSSEWYIERSPVLKPEPDREIALADGSVFTLEKVFRRSSISGTNLYVYHRAGGRGR